ncbi:hypothetical protein BU16DRAFT_542182 [Lophium mytilinum]|uniref:Uncharacterized protein n=1 Tax=Lophium mytilinum TaxID=390894 RepID=A0A6A6QJT3_9PEZI|nr:hypothetical protein BU16DRAFT_542182 [Lophium mytilinum]
MSTARYKFITTRPFQPAISQLQISHGADSQPSFTKLHFAANRTLSNRTRPIHPPSVRREPRTEHSQVSSYPKHSTNRTTKAATATMSRRVPWRYRLFDPPSEPTTPAPSPEHPTAPLSLEQLAANVAPCIPDSPYHLLACGHKIRTPTSMSCGKNCQQPGDLEEFFCARCFTEPLLEGYMSEEMVKARLARAVAEDCGLYKMRECEAVQDREGIDDLMAEMFGEEYEKAEEEAKKEEGKVRKRPGRGSTVRTEEKEGTERKRPGRGARMPQRPMMKIEEAEENTGGELGRTAGTAALSDELARLPGRDQLDGGRDRARSASPVHEGVRRRRSRSPLPRRKETED